MKHLLKLFRMNSNIAVLLCGSYLHYIILLNVWPGHAPDHSPPSSAVVMEE